MFVINSDRDGTQYTVVGLSAFMYFQSKGFSFQSQAISIPDLQYAYH